MAGAGSEPNQSPGTTLAVVDYIVSLTKNLNWIWKQITLYSWSDLSQTIWFDFFKKNSIIKDWEFLLIMSVAANSFLFTWGLIWFVLARLDPSPKGASFTILTSCPTSCNSISMWSAPLLFSYPLAIFPLSKCGLCIFIINCRTILLRVSWLAGGRGKCRCGWSASC